MRELTVRELGIVSGGEEENKVSEIVVVAQKDNSFSNDGGGGWFADFGLGLGLGFNLHVDKNGVDLSFGAGVWGTLQVGHASSDEALADKTSQNKVFVEAEVSGVGVKAQVDTKTDEVKLGLGPASGSTDNQFGLGPVEVSVNKEGPKVDSVTFGVDAGIGFMQDVGHRDWSPPGGTTTSTPAVVTP
jgi:hypothetical protein